MESRSDIFRVIDCPVPTGRENHHEGMDALFDLMGSHGLKLFRTGEETVLGGKEGWIDESDVVIIKVNAQWKFRGCTNSDVIRGLVQRILEHPDGFEGEIVLIENEQGGAVLTVIRCGADDILMLVSMQTLRMKVTPSLTWSTRSLPIQRFRCTF